jgi:hypothetical protein
MKRLLDDDELYRPMFPERRVTNVLLELAGAVAFFAMMFLLIVFWSIILG